MMASKQEQEQQARAEIICHMSFAIFHLPFSTLCFDKDVFPKTTNDKWQTTYGK
jgi:hypothetical protein